MNNGHNLNVRLSKVPKMFKKYSFIFRDSLLEGNYYYTSNYFSKLNTLNLTYISWEKYQRTNKKQYSYRTHARASAHRHTYT